MRLRALSVVGIVACGGRIDTSSVGDDASNDDATDSAMSCVVAGQTESDDGPSVCSENLNCGTLED